LRFDHAKYVGCVLCSATKADVTTEFTPLKLSLSVVFDGINANILRMSTEFEKKIANLQEQITILQNEIDECKRQMITKVADIRRSIDQMRLITAKGSPSQV